MSWYRDENPARFTELSETLCSNINNRFIDVVHIFTFDEKDMTRFPCEMKKIRLVKQRQERFHFSEGLEYANQNLKKQIVLFANSDIEFDDSLENLLFLHDLNSSTFYSLSRYEKDESASIGTQCGEKYLGSHDTFVIIPPVPTVLIRKCNFALGSWGIENRIIYEMKREGITVRNPCLLIHTWHNHKSGVKNEWMPMVNDKNKSEVAFPS